MCLEGRGRGWRRRDFAAQTPTPTCLISPFFSIPPSSLSLRYHHLSSFPRLVLCFLVLASPLHINLKVICRFVSCLLHFLSSLPFLLSSIRLPVFSQSSSPSLPWHVSSFLSPPSPLSSFYSNRFSISISEVKNCEYSHFVFFSFSKYFLKSITVQWTFSLIFKYFVLSLDLWSNARFLCCASGYYIPKFWLFVRGKCILR